MNEIGNHSPWAEYGLPGLIIFAFFVLLMFASKKILEHLEKQAAEHKAERTEWRVEHKAERNEWRENMKTEFERHGSRLDRVCRDLTENIKELGRNRNE